MVTGNIAIQTTTGYCTEAEWRAKYGFSQADESTEQFETDLKEAMFEVRKRGFHLARERLIFIDGNKRAFLPYQWMGDGNMDGSITVADILLYKLSSDGRILDTVSTDNVTSIDAYNNFLQFDTSYTTTTQHYVTYYACGKPLDELTVDWLKRAVMAMVTLLMLQRLRQLRLIKGTSGWSAAGVTVTKNEQDYDEMKNDANNVLKQYVDWIKPLVFRNIRTGTGTGDNRGFQPGIAYSSQMFLDRSSLRRRW